MLKILLRLRVVHFFSIKIKQLQLYRRHRRLSIKIMKNPSQQQNEPSFKILVNDAVAALRTGNSYLEQRSNETTEQREVLRRPGCDYVQGFLFSKPVSAEEFSLFLNPAQIDL